MAGGDDIDITVGGDTSSLIASLDRLEAALSGLGTKASQNFKKAGDDAKKFNDQVTSLGKGADRSQRAFQAASTNMAAQFSDIAVQAQMGANSISVALQQGMQIAPIFQNAAGGVKALGEAFKSMFSFANLGAIAVVFLATEGIKWLNNMLPKQKDANELLKEHEQRLKDIQAALPGVEKATQAMLAQFPQIGQALANVEVGAAKDKLTTEMDALGKSMAATLGQGFTGELGSMFAGDAGLMNAVQGIRDAVAKGQPPDWTQFVMSINASRNALGDLFPILDSNADAAEQYGLAMQDVVAKFGAATGPMLTLIENWRNGTIGITEFINTISTMPGITEEVRNELLLMAAGAGQAMMQVDQANARAAEAARLVKEGNLGAALSFSQMATQIAPTYGKLAELTRDYAQQVQSGTQDSAAFVKTLEGMKAATPDKELQVVIQKLIDTATNLFYVDGAWRQAASGADSSIAAFNAAGEAARLAGEKAAAAARTMQAALAGIASGLRATQSMTDMLDPRGAQLRNLQDLRDEALRGNALSGNFAKNKEDLKLYTDNVTRLKNEWAEADKAAADALSHKGGGGGGGKSPDKMQVGEFGGKDMNLDQLKQWIFAQQSAIDPTIKLREEQEKLQLAIAKGMVTQQEAAAINKHLEEQYGKTASKTFDFAKTFEQMMTSWGDNVASSLADAIVNGEDLGDVFQDLIKQLIKMALQMLVLKPLMDSMMGGFSGMFGGAPAAASAAVPASLSAANQNMLRGLPAPGMVGGRNATVGGGGGTFNSSVGGITINMGGGKGGGVDTTGGKNAQAFGLRVRDLIQNEMTRQSRPGGLLWSGRGR